MTIRASVARALPPSLVGRLGRLQFSMPVLRPLLLWAAGPLRSGEAVLSHGVGRGLKFDPAGGNPGYALGTSDPDEQQALAAYLRPGATFYDIGANVGFFAVLGARLVGAAGRVYAFEPFPRSAGAVRANARRNGFEHVTVFEAAVSCTSGQGTLVVDGSPVHFKLATSPILNAPARSTTAVTMLSIDDLVTSGRTAPPDLVMIDVEGSELDVLEGMKQTLAKHRPVVICEVHWLGARFTEACERLLKPLGYAVTRLDGSALPDGIDRYHALLLPPDQQAPEQIRLITCHDCH